MEQKPLIIELEDAKMEFVKLIQKLQKKGIPCYLIDMSLWSIYQQVQSAAKEELKAAKEKTEKKEDKYENSGD
jgi:hypothetical protein